MRYKSFFFLVMLLVFASACTKIETFYDECHGIAAPTLAQTAFSATYGSMVSNSANKNCTWLAPDGNTYSGSEIDIALTTISRYGTYKVFYYENGCSSDTATFVISMSGTADPPCNAQVDSWLFVGMGMSYDHGFGSLLTNFYPPFQYRYEGSSYGMRIGLWTDTPQIGKVYSIGENVPNQDRAIVSGFDHLSNNFDWTATSGIVYCTPANADSSAVYLTFCDIPILVNDSVTYTLRGKLYYLIGDY